jgi:hypothetical protein
MTFFRINRGSRSLGITGSAGQRGGESGQIETLRALPAMHDRTASSMRSLISMLVVLCVVAVCGQARAGGCKTSFVYDRSGSMATPRSDGALNADGSPQTRCVSAGLALYDALQAVLSGNEYDLKTGEIFAPDTAASPPRPPDEFDINCPNVADRLVSVWVFANDTMVNVTNGFKPVLTAVGMLNTSPYFDSLGAPKDTCAGNTPLAQTMCLSARDFPAGPAPAGEVRQGFILTDGEENYSDLVPLLPNQAPRCRFPGEPIDPATGWGDRVIAEYVAHGVSAHGFLFKDGPVPFAAQRSTRAVPRESASIASFVQPHALTLATGLSADELFLGALAVQTHGTFSALPDNVTLASGNDFGDLDGDGIPNFRDFCPFNACVSTDFDSDGIPDSIDICTINQREDGRGAFPADGCRDTDYDGVRDGKDQCPATIEDYLPPNPSDGCPAVVPAAAPAMPMPFLGVLGLTLLGGAALQLRRRRASC